MGHRVRSRVSVSSEICKLGTGGLELLAETLSHLLTAALDQLRVVASSTSNDLGSQSGQHQHQASSTCCNHVLRGRPGGRFQSAAAGGECLGGHYMNIREWFTDENDVAYATVTRY